MQIPIAIVVLALLLTACGEPAQNAPQPGETIQLPPIEWRVRDKAGLEAAYVNSNMRITKGDRVIG